MISQYNDKKSSSLMKTYYSQRLKKTLFKIIFTLPLKWKIEIDNAFLPKAKIIKGQ